MKVDSTLQNVDRQRGGQATLSLFGLPGTGLSLRKSPPCPATEIVTALLDGDQYRALEAIARTENRSVRALIRAATREYVQRQRAATVDLHAPAQPCTSAMRAAARGSDERERSHWAYENEQADFWHRLGGDADADIQTWEAD